MKKDSIDQLATTARMRGFADIFITSIEDNLEKGKGFYWSHYGSFFVALKKSGYLDTACNIVCMSADETAKDWVQNNDEKVGAFYDWMKERSWKQ